MSKPTAKKRKTKKPEIRLIFVEPGNSVPRGWLRGFTEVCAYTGVKDSRTIRRWMKDGLQHSEREGKYFFKREWVDDFIMGGETQEHLRVLREGLR